MNAFCSCAGFILLAASLSSSVSQADNQPDKTLTRSDKQVLINDLNAVLLEQYIFEDTARQIADHLTTRFSAGAYDSMNTAVAFCQTIEGDMFALSQDKHLGFLFDPHRAASNKAQRDENSDEAKAARKREFEADRLQNFGFLKMEILAGNIGYLDLRLFPDPVYGSDTAVAAMNFLANADAVIIDLRYNGGGWGEMVALLCSYFFKERTELNAIQLRKGNKLEQAWTMPFVPGKRLDGTDLYILTSSRTFSAAEDFTYAMKTLNRATIIGECTKGGAHPVEDFIIRDEYILIVPNATSVNPITGKNWEGTGIEPHIAVPQEKALLEAHRHAAEKLLEKRTDRDAKRPLQWAIESLKRKLDPLTIDEKILKRYVGQYGERQIVLEAGDLYYIRQIRYRLIPLSETLFMPENAEDMRIQFTPDEKGNVSELLLLLHDGSCYPITRNPQQQS